MAREEQYEGLMDASLDISASCTTATCKVNRAIVEYGPLSVYAPWAKAAGNALNFNCSLILMPIVRMLLRYVNNVGTSFNRAQHKATLFARLFAHPLTR